MGFPLLLPIIRFLLNNMAMFKIDSDFNLEAMINRWVQRLFPQWYACAACKEVELHVMGSLNPQSFLQSNWLNVKQIVNLISQASKEDKSYQKLHRLLEQLIITRKARRNFDIHKLSAVLFAEQPTDYLNILAYAQNRCNELEMNSNQDFERHLALCFPPEERPIQVAYQEWDGRYFWKNKQEPLYLGALFLQNSKGRKRDVILPAEIEVACFKSAVIDEIVDKYWVLVLHYKSVPILNELFELAGFHRQIISLPQINPTLRILVADKQNKALNTAVMNLLLNHGRNQVTDLFRYLQRRYKPFK